MGYTSTMSSPLPGVTRTNVHQKQQQTSWLGEADGVAGAEWRGLSFTMADARELRFRPRRHGAVEAMVHAGGGRRG